VKSGKWKVESEKWKVNEGMGIGAQGLKTKDAWSFSI